MSEVNLFKKLTSDDFINELESVASSYEGLYVDMDSKDERKFVKEKAALITKLRADIQRSRIDQTGAFKAVINEEAEILDNRLAKANAPFTSLINEHKENRAKILEAEKAKKHAVELAAKKAQDHETAIMMDRILTIDKESQAIAVKEKEKAAAEEAVKQAELDHEKEIMAAKAAIELEKGNAIEAAKASEKAKVEAAKKAESDKVEAVEKAKSDALEFKVKEDIEVKKQADMLREKQELKSANKTHQSNINNGILSKMLEYGLNEEQGKILITAIARKEINNLSINY